MNSVYKKQVNMLSIDGGSSGLPALCILGEILSRLEFDLNSDQELLPWEHFELMIGTGPGGVVVILIGRLRLSASKAVEAYEKLVPVLPSRAAKSEEERKGNSEAFKAVFLEVLESVGFDQNTPMLDKDGAKIVVCTLNTSNPSFVHPIRSYRTRSAQTAPCTILEAACACIAYPDTFLPVIIGSGHRQVTLVDGLAVAANPGKELLREAQRVFGDDAEVATVLSIGAGKGDVWDVSTASSSELREAIKHATMSCEPVHEELYSRLRQTSIYFRLNVERGSGPQMQLSSSAVCAYLEEGMVSDRVDDAIKSIHRRPIGVKLNDINSVTVIGIALKPRPSLVDNFIGREDVLEAMRQTHLTQRSMVAKRTAITVLSGLGGAGKTQTALKFALEFEEQYPDSPVYFVNASAEETLKAELENIIHSRGVEYRASSYQDALTWLATKLDDWLVILDNADDPSFRLIPYIAQSSRGNVIITTRNVNHALLAPNSSHHLEGLSTEDAIKLVLTASGYEHTDENRALARAIVEVLGHLPLALAQAAGYIFVHRRLSTYIVLYQQSAKTLLAARPSELPYDYPSSVAATIQMSLDRLPARVLNILEIFSHLDSSSIAHAIISKAAGRTFQSVVRTEKHELRIQTQEQADSLKEIFCANGEWSEVEFDDLIRSCLQYSLLRLTTRGSSNFYSMHILVQSYLRAKVDMVQGHQPGPLAVRLLASSSTYSDDYTYLTFNRLLLPHLRQIRMEDVVEAGDHYGFGNAVRKSGDLRLAALHFERCVEIWAGTLGDEHENTLAAMAELAISYKQIGNFQKAFELEERVLDVQKRILGEEHHITLVTAGNLAESHRRLGRRKEAMELGEKVLEAWRRVMGPEDVQTMKTMATLAVSYKNFDRNQEALELEEQVLEIRKRILGPEDTETLMAMINLANSYRVVGRKQEALELNQQALEMQKKILGDEQPATLFSMRSRLLILRDLGMAEQLQDLLRVTVPAHEKVLGLAHPSILKLKKNFKTELEML